MKRLTTEQRLNHRSQTKDFKKILADSVLQPGKEDPVSSRTTLSYPKVTANRSIPYVL